VKQIILEEKQPCDEVSVHFISAKEMCRMHGHYFGDASLTDCISFPIDIDEKDEHYRVLGDVFVCPKQAIEYSHKHRLDPYVETTLYIVHGLLHLMGYDDIEKEDAAQIRKAEKRQMNKLKKLSYPSILMPTRRVLRAVKLPNYHFNLFIVCPFLTSGCWHGS
jgi:probable rRNA maturation factor